MKTISEYLFSHTFISESKDPEFELYTAKNGTEYAVVFIHSKANGKKIWELHPDAKIIHFASNSVFIKKNLEKKSTKRINAYWCEECHNFFETEQDGYTKERFYCQECFDENYAQCNHCGGIIEQGDAFYVEDEGHFCDDCYHEKFIECHHCGRVESEEDAFVDPDGESYCERCWSDLCISCADCGDVIWTDDARYNEGTGESYCGNCYNFGTIKSYEYDPDYFDFKHKNEKNPMYIGFELEVEMQDGNDDRDANAEDLLNWMQEQGIDNRYYFKEDSTLTNGFEIVSHPATKQMHRTYKIKAMLDWLTSHKMTSHQTGNCGLHFHIDKSRRGLKEIDIKKLKTFVHLNAKHIFRISRRRTDPFESNAHIEDYTPADFKADFGINNGNRHVAVNVNSNTVEIRIFRGTLNYNSFRASLLFVDALVSFIKQTSAICLFNGKSWSDFMNYIKKDEYRIVYNYLKSKKEHLTSMTKTYGIKSHIRQVLEQERTVCVR